MQQEKLYDITIVADRKYVGYTLEIKELANLLKTCEKLYGSHYRVEIEPNLSHNKLIKYKGNTEKYINKEKVYYGAVDKHYVRIIDDSNTIHDIDIEDVEII